MVRFGGPVFMGSAKAAGAGESHGAAADDPVALARAHRAKGFTAAYAPHAGINETDKIRAIREAFAAEDVIIAEVGFWENLVDTDPDPRGHRQHPGRPLFPKAARDLARRVLTEERCQEENAEERVERSG